MRSRQASLLDDWQELEPEPRKVNGHEELFASQCRQFQLPPFEQQHLFAKAAMQRNWRFDFAWREYKVAVEIEGLIPTNLWRATLDGPSPVERGGVIINVVKCERLLVVLGRHATIGGIKGDMEKYNAAALLGWSVLRFEQKDVKPKHAIETTMRVLAERGWRQQWTSS